MTIRSLSVYCVAALIGFLATATPSPSSAQAQMFRVGPDGQYATISAALSDLFASPNAINWIRVQAGVTTFEHFSIPATWTNGTIWLSGSWNASFTDQSGDPTDTVISGWTSDRVIDVSMAGGILIISDLTIANGASEAGAGLQIIPTNDSAIRLDNLRISNNTASGTGTVIGGAIRATLESSSSLDIDNCEILGNHATGTDPGAEAFGGAIDIESSDMSTFSITDCWVHDNTATSQIQVGGAGIHLTLLGESSGVLTDSLVEGNLASSTGPISVTGTGLRVSTFATTRLDVTRTRFLSNTVGTTGVHDQVYLYSRADSILSVTDSIVADGPANGMYVRASGQSLVYATNLTLATNAGDGIIFSRDSTGTADVYFSNSVAALNGGSDLRISSGPVTQTANLVGIDPEFVDPQDLDFRVEIGSIAEDAGVPAPAGGLGVVDIRGGIRSLGASPDAGAYEGNVSLIFSDGFDLKGARRWSDVVGGPSQ